jgi:dynein intermediate chain
VLKSPLSSNGHTHPIYDLKVVGTKTANNLFSASADGTACAWQLDMLGQPLVILHAIRYFLPLF